MIADGPKPEPWIVRDLGAVSRFFGVAPSTIRSEWRPAGMPGEPGRWDLAEIYRWREARRRERQTGAAADDGDLSARKRLAEVLLVEEQYRKALLGNELEAGGLVRRDEIERAAAELVLTIKGRLEGIPDALEMNLPVEVRHQCKADVAATIRRLLTAMAAAKLVGGRSVEDCVLIEAERIRAARAEQEETTA